MGVIELGPILTEVERDFLAGVSMRNQHRWNVHRVGQTQLVKYVGVVGRQIGDDEIRVGDPADNVRQDVLPSVNVVRPVDLEASIAKRL